MREREEFESQLGVLLLEEKLTRKQGRKERIKRERKRR